MAKPDPRRAAVIIEARQWLGTRYHHQAALKGVGCDCGGLVRGVGAETGLLSIDPQEWATYGNYGRLPHPERMRATLARFLVPVPPSRARLGDIAWMQWRENLPMHLAILSRIDIDNPSRPTIIHALSDNDQVIEHTFSKEWQDRVASWWRYPGLVSCKA